MFGFSPIELASAGLLSVLFAILFAIARRLPFWELAQALVRRLPTWGLILALVVAMIALLFLQAIDPPKARGAEVELAKDRRLLTSRVWPLQRNALEAGFFLWRYRQSRYGAWIKPALVQAYAEWAYVSTMGAAENETWGVTSYATGGNEFVYGNGYRPGCGAFALACLATYGPDLEIWYDSASMAGWDFRSQTAVGLHEDGHQLFDLGEWYPHIGSAYCDGDPASVMSCGYGHALFIQPFDAENVRLFAHPGAVRGAALNLTWGAVFYGESQKYDEFGRALAGEGNCTRTAIVWQQYGGPLTWSGINGPCSNAPGLYGVGVPIRPGTCYYVGAENALPATWGRNLVFAGCTN